MELYPITLTTPCAKDGQWANDSGPSAEFRIILVETLSLPKWAPNWVFGKTSLGRKASPQWLQLTEKQSCFWNAKTTDSEDEMQQGNIKLDPWLFPRKIFRFRFYVNAKWTYGRTFYVLDWPSNRKNSPAIKVARWSPNYQTNDLLSGTAPYAAACSAFHLQMN